MRIAPPQMYCDHKRTVGALWPPHHHPRAIVTFLRLCHFFFTWCLQCLTPLTLSRRDALGLVVCCAFELATQLTRLLHSVVDQICSDKRLGGFLTKRIRNNKIAREHDPEGE